MFDGRRGRGNSKEFGPSLLITPPAEPHAAFDGLVRPQFGQEGAVVFNPAFAASLRPLVYPAFRQEGPIHPDNRRELGEVRGIRRHVDRQFFDLPGDGDAAAVQGKKPRRRRP